MANMLRVVIPVDSMDVTSWKLAVRYALEIANKTSPPATDVVLLTHTKSQLDHTSLASHLGQTVTKALSKGEIFNLDSAVRLRFATLRTLGHSTRNSVVIAFYADERMLETLDGQRGVVGIAAVPQFDGDIDQWINIWNPVVHGRKPEATKPLIDDPVIEKALESITTKSNTDNAVLHTDDRKFADGVFRILRAKGHKLDPTAIKSWAIRANWKPDAADELCKVAAKVAKFKNKPSLGAIHNPDEHYERWKS